MTDSVTYDLNIFKLSYNYRNNRVGKSSSSMIEDHEGAIKYDYPLPNFRSNQIVSPNFCEPGAYE